MKEDEGKEKELSVWIQKNDWQGDQK